MKFSNSYILSILGIVSLTILGIVKDLDVSMAISGIILSYVGARAGQKAMFVRAAAQDDKVCTESVIRDLK
jgi:hypothetical protein